MEATCVKYLLALSDTCAHITDTRDNLGPELAPLSWAELLLRARQHGMPSQVVQMYEAKGSSARYELTDAIRALAPNWPPRRMCASGYSLAKTEAGWAAVKSESPAPRECAQPEEPRDEYTDTVRSLRRGFRLRAGQGLVVRRGSVCRVPACFCL
eukprot:COSAG01_NODE_5040_length_4530_cov_1.740465_3_plen_154_part_01